MTKIDINLDAYHLSSESLLRIRQILRESLRAIHGKEWEVTGIPAELRDYLTQRHAREASINWHLSDAADILDFTGFVDLYDVIAANAQLLQRFLAWRPMPTFCASASSSSTRSSTGSRTCDRLPTASSASSSASTNASRRRQALRCRPSRRRRAPPPRRQRGTRRAETDSQGRPSVPAAGRAEPRDGTQASAEGRPSEGRRLPRRHRRRSPRRRRHPSTRAPRTRRSWTGHQAKRQQGDPDGALPGGHVARRRPVERLGGVVARRDVGTGSRVAVVPRPVRQARAQADLRLLRARSTRPRKDGCRHVAQRLAGVPQGAQLRAGAAVAQGSVPAHETLTPGGQRPSTIRRAPDPEQPLATRGDRCASHARAASVSCGPHRAKQTSAAVEEQSVRACGRPPGSREGRRARRRAWMRAHAPPPAGVGGERLVGRERAQQARLRPPQARATASRTPAPQGAREPGGSGSTQKSPAPTLSDSGLGHSISNTPAERSADGSCLDDRHPDGRRQVLDDVDGGHATEASRRPARAAPQGRRPHRRRGPAYDTQRPWPGRRPRRALPRPQSRRTSRSSPRPHPRSSTGAAPCQQRDVLGHTSEDLGSLRRGSCPRSASRRRRSRPAPRHRRQRPTATRRGSPWASRSTRPPSSRELLVQRARPAHRRAPKAPATAGRGAPRPGPAPPRTACCILQEVRPRRAGPARRAGLRPRSEAPRTSFGARSASARCTGGSRRAAARPAGCAAAPDSPSRSTRADSSGTALSRTCSNSERVARYAPRTSSTTAESVVQAPLQVFPQLLTRRGLATQHRPSLVDLCLDLVQVDPEHGAHDRCASGAPATPAWRR